MSALADQNDKVDQPNPGETFTHFFQRITSGGLFRGIVLNAPDNFQTAFLPRIYRPSWQGRLDKVEEALEKAGVDLWLNWYQTSQPLKILSTDSVSEKIIAQSYEQAARELGRCRSACRDWSEIEKVGWGRVSTEERQAMAWAYVTKAPIFSGRSLIDFLADQHGMKKADVISRIDFRLLHESAFEAAVKQLGWDGEIYFRGITAPSPKDPHVFWILLDDDLMRKMTPFKRPLLQALEYCGILAHEISHVFQNAAAERLNIDLSIHDPEGALLVEGEAEWLTERAMDAAGVAQGKTSPLPLFSAEAASEIVNRPGQEEQGNLFPYTVGVPFAAALFDLQAGAAREAALRTHILQVIGGQITLEEMLKEPAH